MALGICEGRPTAPQRHQGIGAVRTGVLAVGRGPRTEADRPWRRRGWQALLFTMFGRPLLAVLTTLSLVVAVACQPRRGSLQTAVLVFESALLGAALVWLAQSLDASGLTHFGRWFYGH